MTLCARCMEAGSKALLHAIDGARFGRGEGLPRPPGRVTVRGLVQHAAPLFEVAAGELAGRGRFKRLTRARKAIAWVARRATGLSWPAIARAFGGRDHSTMIYNAGAGDWLISHEPDFAWRVERLWAAGECAPWGPRGGAFDPETPWRVPPPEPVDPDAAPPTLWRRAVRTAPGEYVPTHALPLTLAMLEEAA